MGRGCCCADERGVWAGVLLSVGCLTSQQHANVSPHNMLVYLRDGSAQTSVHTATLR